MGRKTRNAKARNAKARNAKARNADRSACCLLPAARLLAVCLLPVAFYLLAACAGPAGDPSRGRQLFAGELAFADGRAVVCSSCHSVRAEEGPGIGPNLAGVATIAGGRVPGLSAEEYLRTALLDPDAYLVQPYQEGIMYRGYAEALTPQELSDLVAYLLTLR